MLDALCFMIKHIFSERDSHLRPLGLPFALCASICIHIRVRFHSHGFPTIGPEVSPHQPRDSANRMEFIVYWRRRGAECIRGDAVRRYVSAAFPTK